jgi:hypothetical protein
MRRLDSVLPILNSILPSLLICAAIGSSSFGQIAPPTHVSPWNILVEGGKGKFYGDPVCHPLENFSGSPFQFDYENDLYGRSRRTVRVQTEVKRLGVVKGRQVVQVEQNINSGDLIMKRLLVQRRGGEFCAIYQQQYPMALVQVSPARIESIKGEPVLVTRDRNGLREYNEAYWTFDADGPILLDLTVIDNTLKGVLPPGHEVRGDYGLDIKGLCYHSNVWKTGECSACTSGGTVVLKLGLEHHRLVVVRKLFDPDGRTDANACAP